MKLPAARGVCSSDQLERSLESVQTQLALDEMRDMQRCCAYPTSLTLPIGFQLELTSKCNLTCRHCYNASGGRGEDDLSLPEWERVIEEIASIRPAQVILSGGEPLILGDNLFRLMDRLNEGWTRFVLITNGLLATEALIDRLCQYQWWWIQVSVDGVTSELHDGFRGLHGSWQRAVQAAFWVSMRGRALVIAHAVYQRNVDSLAEMIDFAAVLGATRIICDESMPVGRAHAAWDDLRLSPAQRQAMVDVICMKQQEYAGKMEVLRTSDPANSFELYLSSPCTVLLIRPNGDVKLDCVLPFVIGNVRTQSLREIWETRGRYAWQHPRIQEFVRKYQAHNDFNDCEARPYVDADIRLQDLA